MLEFKLQYYFQEYKDKCIISYPRFENNFIKKHGKFILIKELYNMIREYQINKYGDLIYDGRDTAGKCIKKGYYEVLERGRKYKRFGNITERRKRKQFYGG